MHLQATIGGTLQFWLGAGVVTIVHWIVFVHDQVKRAMMVKVACLNGVRICVGWW